MGKLHLKRARWFDSRCLEDRHRRIALLLVLAVLVFATGGASFGQGRTDYMNVESPTGHPIEVFEVGGHHYIAVANTRDSSVEIFDTDETADVRRLARIRVGLEPVSIRFNEKLQALFTAGRTRCQGPVEGLFAWSGPRRLQRSFSTSLAVLSALQEPSLISATRPHPSYEENRNELRRSCLRSDRDETKLGARDL